MLKKEQTLLLTMLMHLDEFNKKRNASGVKYEKRDDDGKKLAESIDKIAKAFEEYKSATDKKIQAVEQGKSTSELDEKINKINEEIDSLREIKANIELMQKKMARPGYAHQEKTALKEDVEYKEAFLGWVRNPKDLGMQQKCTTAGRALAEKSHEFKATQVITSLGSSGGYAVPTEISREILRLGVDLSPMRQIATVKQVGTEHLTEIVDTGGSSFEWVGEEDDRNQTNTPDLHEIAPFFGLASAKPQVSEYSLDDMFFDVESWLTSSIQESISKGEGAAFIGGNGIKKPKGFLAYPMSQLGDATRKFGELQYVASGNAATMPESSDVLLDMVYALRSRYRSNAIWLASKTTVSALRKYKDSTGAYLWQPSLVAGQPDMFMGYRIVECEDMPLVAANSIPLAFGDFKEGYLIADRVGMRITRDEITKPGFVRFYARQRVGGCLRNSQAIKLLKITA